METKKKHGVFQRKLWKVTHTLSQTLDSLRIQDMFFHPHGTLLLDSGTSARELPQEDSSTTPEMFSQLLSHPIIGKSPPVEEIKLSRSGTLWESANTPLMLTLTLTGLPVLNSIKIPKTPLLFLPPWIRPSKSGIITQWLSNTHLLDTNPRSTLSIWLQAHTIWLQDQKTESPWPGMSKMVPSLERLIATARSMPSNSLSRSTGSSLPPTRESKYGNLPTWKRSKTLSPLH